MSFTPGGIASGLAGFGVSAVFDAAGNWVATGASWLLDTVGSVLSSTTAVPIGTAWFGAHESVMAALAAAVILPMACCSVMQAVLHQNLSALTRSLLLHLPLALLLTGVAVELVHLGLALTDELSAQVMAAGGTDTRNLLKPLSDALAAGTATGSGVPSFVLFVAGLLTAVAALGLWLELVVRAAAVSAATLFLPLALAALVWPAVAHWCRRLADTLVALILSKLVVAAVLSLAAGALAGGLGVEPGPGGGIASVVTGVALLIIATTAPFTLLRLVPAVEAGAVAHLESTRHRLRQAGQAPMRTANLALDVAAAAGTGGGSELASVAAAGVGAPAGPGGDAQGAASGVGGVRPWGLPQPPGEASGARSGSSRNARDDGRGAFDDVGTGASPGWSGPPEGSSIPWLEGTPLPAHLVDVWNGKVPGGAYDGSSHDGTAPDAVRSVQPDRDDDA
jgi:hypothetical protein